MVKNRTRNRSFPIITIWKDPKNFFPGIIEKGIGLFSHFFSRLSLFLTLLSGCSSNKERETLPSTPGPATEIADFIQVLETANQIVLLQSDEPELQTVLNEEQRDSLIINLEGLESYDMPSPHGSGYPGYTVVAFNGEQEIARMEIQDTVYALIQPYSYYSGAEELWDNATSWLPIKNSKPGMLENLFKATRVVITESATDSIIEYDLEKEPYLAFRPANLLRLLKTAETDISFEPENADPIYIIDFYIDNQKEILKVYDHFAYSGGIIYKMEDIGRIMGTNINAG